MDVQLAKIISVIASSVHLLNQVFMSFSYEIKMFVKGIVGRGQTSITAQLYRVIEFELSMERHYLFNHQVVNSCSKAPKAY